MIILGAGLAGLSAAERTGGCIYEQDSVPGGHAKSKTTDGFVFDEGIHILQTGNQQLLDFFHGAGIRFQEHRRSGHIHTHGVLRPYPLQVNTAGLSYFLRAECVSRFLVSRLRPPDSSPQPANYEEWLNRSLGRGFARHFLIPYCKKFWTIPPCEMTYEWTANRVPRPGSWPVVKGAFKAAEAPVGTHVQFRYPSRGGFGALAEAFRPKAPEIRFGMRLTRLDLRRKTLQFNGRVEVPYDRVISTVPLPDLIAMTEGVPGDVQTAVRRLRHNSIFIVNLGIDRPDISDKHWIHFPEKGISFFRISFPCNFAPGLAPAGTTSLQAEVAYSEWAPIDKSRIVDRVIEDLRRLNILASTDKVILTETVDSKYGYVIFDHARPEALKTIHDFLRRHDIYPAGRYGDWAYHWSDDAIVSGQRAAAEALGEVRTAP